MNTCWKFQNDILTLIWIIVKWLKICCNKWPPAVHIPHFCTAGGHLLQQIFSYSAINQIPIKISSWNFQHLFITSLCQIDKKNLVPTQSACQPRPISAKTLNVSSDHICWDILKRKKLGGFQTISNDWLEGIFDILKKTAFWNFLIELWVHPNAVHGLLMSWIIKCALVVLKFCQSRCTHW